MSFGGCFNLLILGCRNILDMGHGTVQLIFSCYSVGSPPYKLLQFRNACLCIYICLSVCLFVCEFYWTKSMFTNLDHPPSIGRKPIYDWIVTFVLFKASSLKKQRNFFWLIHEFYTSCLEVNVICEICPTLKGIQIPYF